MYVCKGKKMFYFSLKITFEWYEFVLNNCQKMRGFYFFIIFKINLLANPDSENILASFFLLLPRLDV